MPRDTIVGYARSLTAAAWQVLFGDTLHLYKHRATSRQVVAAVGKVTE